jgi:hypothetical protein
MSDPIHTIQDDGSVYIDMPSDDSNPCLNCGACCSHFRISFYHSELDYHPSGQVPDKLAVKVNDTFACMQGTIDGGRCVALQGEIGKQISCAIYENRPSPCRKYAVWEEDGTPNHQCQTLRKQIGIVPLVPRRPASL